MTYVAMVTTNDEYGLYIAKRIKEIDIKQGVCVEVIEKLTVSWFLKKLARVNTVGNGISLVPPCSFTSRKHPFKEMTEVFRLTYFSIAKGIPIWCKPLLETF